MGKNQNRLRIFISIIMAFVITMICCTMIIAQTIPDKFYITRGNKFSINRPFIVASTTPFNNNFSTVNTKGQLQSTTFKLLGIVPIKTARLEIIDELYKTPGGTPFGIKLFTKGVIIVELSTIETNIGKKSPAKIAGLNTGDIITTMNGQEVMSNDDIAYIASLNKDKPIKVSYKRHNIEESTTITPVLSIDNKYKCGLWVRDSAAGIGTITYYDEGSMQFAGLGHAICDYDTGELMPLATGEVCDVTIEGITKGQPSAPGEIRGSFNSAKSVGSLYNNTQTGLYGELKDPPNNLQPVRILLKQEVVKGKAIVLCSIDNTGAKEYEITIDAIDLNPKTMTKNMTITITDPKLLAKTGGIVQGMSGSPIMQNGGLVGAVSHVFVNNPKRGYAIFAETMVK